MFKGKGHKIHHISCVTANFYQLVPPGPVEGADLSIWDVKEEELHAAAESSRGGATEWGFFVFWLEAHLNTVA